MEKIYKCKYCEFTTSDNKKIAGHTTCCKNNPNYFKNLENILNGNKKRIEKIWFEYKSNCMRCGKEFLQITTNAIIKRNKHKKCCCEKCSRSNKRTDEQKVKISSIMKAWNKKHPGSNKRKNIESKKINKVCEFCKKQFFILPYQENKRKFCSRECSDKGKNSTNCGGYREKGGRGKQGRYKGYFCNSSWELAWIIYQLEHNPTLKFERNTNGFPYEFEGKVYQFYPDFYLPEKDLYVEIKGYKSKQVEGKLKYFPHKIEVLYEKEIKGYIKYCENKYGKDFIKLYEK